MQERRRSLRVRVRIPVLCEPTGGELFAGMMVTAGLDGCCIECSNAPPRGTQLAITARLPGAPQLSRSVAVVRWAATRAFGVQLASLGAREMSFIAELAANRATAH
jgi:hypothetical protein